MTNNIHIKTNSDKSRELYIDAEVRLTANLKVIDLSVNISLIDSLCSSSDPSGLCTITIVDTQTHVNMIKQIPQY